MKKTLLLSVLLSSYSFFGQATLPAYEGFQYDEGTLLINDGSNTGSLSSNWFETAARATSDAFIVATPAWTYSGLPTYTGNSFFIQGAGNKPEFNFTPQLGGYGQIYTSCLIKVTDVSALTEINGREFFGFAYVTSTGGLSVMAQAFIKKNADGFQLGINLSNSGTTIWDPKVFNVGDELFIVIKKSEDTSNSDDCKLWINPVINGTEPTTTLKTGPRAVRPSKIRIVQYNAAGTPGMYIDEIRVAKTWVEVTGGTLGLKDKSISNLKVYPNPVVVGKLFIECENNSSINLKVFNLLGQKVLEAKAENNTEINVSQLTKGEYIMNISIDGKSESKKLIIQ